MMINIKGKKDATTIQDRVKELKQVVKDGENTLSKMQEEIRERRSSIKELEEQKESIIADIQLQEDHMKVAHRHILLASEKSLLAKAKLEIIAEFIEGLDD